MKKYRKFSEEINLLCDKTFLLGPFNFMPKDSSTPAQSVVHVDTWIHLNEIYEAWSILPPTIGKESEKTAANIGVLSRKLGGSNFLSVKACTSLDLVRTVLDTTTHD